MRSRVMASSFVVALTWLALLPGVAHAQSAIVGVIRDASGGVMPGVTVEAASPQLIEKVRSVVTDERGTYQIRDLRPGVYGMTFTLPGFSTVKRDAIELPTDFTATVNAEMRVGAIEETVTVSGASPVVDVQSTTKAQVLTRDLLDAIPTGRTWLPGVSARIWFRGRAATTFTAPSTPTAAGIPGRLRALRRA